MPCPPGSIELWMGKGSVMLGAGLMKVLGWASASVLWLCQQMSGGGFPFSLWLIVRFKNDCKFMVGVRVAYRAMVVRLVPSRKAHEPGINTLNSLVPGTPTLGESGGIGSRIQLWPGQMGRTVHVSLQAGPRGIKYTAALRLAATSLPAQG